MLIICAAFFAAPFIYISLTSIQIEPNEITTIFKRFNVLKLFLNTLVLLVSVGFLSGVIGLVAAWFIAIYDIPFKNIFSVFLIFPLAFPAYVLAFSWTGFFGFTGLLNKVIFPDKLIYIDNFRNLLGASIVLSLALYPYVFLIAKSAFETMGKRTMEISSLHGYSTFQAFFRVIIPQTRPWIVSSLLLVCFEVLSDFGAVSILGVNTFTTAIYKAWYGYFRFDHAMVLAFVLILKVLIFLWFLKKIEGRKSYTQTGRSEAYEFPSKQTTFVKKSLIVMFLIFVCIFSFIIPLSQLIHWSLYNEQIDVNSLSKFTFNTFSLSSIATIITVTLSLMIGYIQKTYSSRLGNYVEFLIKSGYAYPGTVIAIAIFVPFIYISNYMSSIFNTNIYIQNSIIPLVLGYIIRYTSVAYSSINSGYQRLKKNLIDSVNLVTGSFRIKLLKVIYPTLKPSIITAFILSFIDISKEMPLTLMTRPFGYDTLAVKIYELTSEGEWERSALPALIIIALGFVPIFITYFLRRNSVRS